jgi:hypothetical protein
MLTPLIAAFITYAPLALGIVAILVGFKLVLTSIARIFIGEQERYNMARPAYVGAVR